MEHVPCIDWRKAKKFVFLRRLLKLRMRRIKRVDKWTSILESNPKANGTYYVYDHIPGGLYAFIFLIIRCSFHQPFNEIHHSIAECPGEYKPGDAGSDARCV